MSPIAPAAALPPATTVARASIAHLPANLFAAVIGIAGLALAWRLAVPAFGAPQWIGDATSLLAFAVFALLALAYLVKAIVDPAAVRAEFRHPVTSNFFGTITISLLLLSSLAAPLNQLLADTLWLTGAVTSLALCFVAASRLLNGTIDPAQALPVWFIPGVATLDIAVAGGAPGAISLACAHQINLLGAAIGTLMALLFFMMIVPRLIHHAPLPPAMTPSLLIIMAPFEVGFIAYTNLTGRIDNFAALLFYAGLFLFVLLLPKVIRGAPPFGAGWWAIGFPMAALTISAIKYAVAVQAWPLTALAIALLAASSATIAVLLLRTAHWLVAGKLLLKSP